MSRYFVIDYYLPQTAQWGNQEIEIPECPSGQVTMEMARMLRASIQMVIRDDRATVVLMHVLEVTV